MLRIVFFYIGLVIGALLSFDVFAEKELAVVYPNVPAPFNEIFKEIIAGLDEAYQGDIRTLELAKKDKTEKAIDWINETNPAAVIALASQGYHVAKAINGTRPVLVSALPISPSGLSGISLVPAPSRLFNALQELAPSVKTINVVYSHRSEWVIPMAQFEAKQKGYKLNAVKVATVKEALQAYDKVLSRFDIIRDALWIPLDPISGNEQVIIPTLLERSWEQNLILFSSKPAHVKRGALFTLFPNHVELGKSLVKMLQEKKNLAENPLIKPMTDTELAVNLRTAAHLGFEYKNQQKSQFYLTFPE